MMKKLKQLMHRALGFMPYFARTKPLVKRIWYDEKKGQIFIHTNCRSGLFYLPVQGGKQYSYWLADIYEIRDKKLPKNETIYRMMDIKEEAPEKTRFCMESGIKMTSSCHTLGARPVVPALLQMLQETGDPGESPRY